MQDKNENETLVDAGMNLRPARALGAGRTAPVSGRRIAAWVMLAVGVIVGVAGVVMATHHDDKAAMAAAHDDVTDDFACILRGGTALRCDTDEAKDAVKAAEAKSQQTGWIVAGLGTLVAVGGAVVLLMPVPAPVAATVESGSEVTS